MKQAKKFQILFFGGVKRSLQTIALTILPILFIYFSFDVDAAGEKIFYWPVFTIGLVMLLLYYSMLPISLYDGTFNDDSTGADL